MADSAETPSRRYSAFISYNHSDTAFARRLQRQLETYRLPRRIAAKSGVVMGRTRRLKPTFRDSTELSASYDLTTAVRDAISESDHLIVVCSPKAAKSDWVGREIECFRALHGDDAIHAVIAEGEHEVAFHPALRGWLGGPSIEPLAADFRPDGDGERLAVLKLVAALAGVGLDDLVHRDGQRRLRQASVLAAAAAVGAAILGTFAFIAASERRAADQERTKAVSLVDFMHTGLRRDLRSAGRTDVLAAINRQALDYFNGKDLARLSVPDLQQRARVLQATGEDEEKRGNLAAAQAAFEDARRTTGALLAKAPNDPQRIFDHAQSEFWIGFINWRTGDGGAARKGFEAYADLAAKLVRIDPKNDAWIMERVYATKNLGALAQRQAGDSARAERFYLAALTELALVLKHKPGDADALIEVADARAWVADSQRLQGDLQGALENREAERKVLTELLAKDPRNVEVQGYMLAYDLAVARIEAEQGKLGPAIRRLEAGQANAEALMKIDPENREFAKQARMFQLFKVRTWLSMPRGQQPPEPEIEAALGDCAPAAATATSTEIADFCGILLARVRAAQGDERGALAALAPVQAHFRKEHDVLSAHWGLNLAEEARPIKLADAKPK